MTGLLLRRLQPNWAADVYDKLLKNCYTALFSKTLLKALTITCYTTGYPLRLGYAVFWYVYRHYSASLYCKRYIEIILSILITFSSEIRMLTATNRTQSHAAD